MDGGLAGAARVLAGRRTLVLTGAGVSTDSGIPDYRGPGRARRAPMMFGEFRSSPQARQRYWARSHAGWTRVAAARPNGGHRAVAVLQWSGAASGLVTQNVDGLHRAAGSSELVELHGRLADVVCLDCGDRSPRERLQVRLRALNPGFGDECAAIAPDGDVELRSVAGFRVAGCERCGGVLKPDVVFFGENVPRDRVERCYGMVDRSDALLVAGSSLTVLSGFRFVRHAHARGIPVVIVNRGPTRGDELATVKVDCGCSSGLATLARALSLSAALTG